MPDPETPEPSHALSTAPVLPDGVGYTEVHGAPALVIDRHDTRAVLHLDGAHLTSWAPAGGRELLWTSPLTRLGRGEAIRGGIPLVGPWFGPGRDGRAPVKHGWLRTSRWAAESINDGEDLSILLRLDEADPSGQGMRARARFVFSRDTLSVGLQVTAGHEAVDLESALHTYLAVSDVEQVGLHGFADADYLDNTAGLRRRTQTDEPRIAGEVDRVYEVSHPVQVIDPGWERRIEVVPEGSSRTVLWNPGAAVAQGMSDMPDDGWRDFVCVETAVCKEGFVHLEPGGSHTLRAVYRPGT